MNYDNIKMYYIILFIGIALTLLSLIIEYNYPFIDNHNIINEEYINVENIKYESIIQKERRCNNINIFLLRFIHFLVFFYSAFYFLFFSFNDDKDVYLFLTTTFIIVLHWQIFGYCILSYNELKSYDINIKNYTTTFHPTMFSLFGKNTDHIVKILGILMILNVITVLTVNSNIELKYKLIYTITYFYLFYKSMLSSRGGGKEFYLN